MSTRQAIVNGFGDFERSRHFESRMKLSVADGAKKFGECVVIKTWLRSANTRNASNKVFWADGWR